MNAIEQWLYSEWAEKLAQAIASMTGESPKASIGEEVGEGPVLDAVLWLQQEFSSSPGAALWTGAPAETWKAIGKEVLKAAGIDDGDEDSVRTTYTEILNQSLSGLAQSMSARLRREIACGAVSQSKPEQGGVRSAQIELGGVSLVFFLSVNTALASAFESPAPAGRDVSTSDNGGDERQRASSETRPYPKGLDLLLDVELPVSLSFGRAELALRDVIKLTTGSIVELNRSLAEPVEVIVNNVVIARGEVVVVEGNFGVRIKEVISRQERLRTLR